jgi:hypothetical protein
MTLEATSAIDNPWVKQAFESLPETRNGDWQGFRLNTIAKLMKGTQEPNKKIFDALYDWMYTVNKGPDLETISEN